MSDYAASWELSRQRFLDSFRDLDQTALNWRIHPGALTIAEMALHVAGVELSFATQLLQTPTLTPEQAKLKAAATEGVVNDNPFPYSPEESTPETVAAALDLAKSILEPVIREASPEVRAREIKSALGPIITGDGAFARLGFHAGYHQGQVHLVRTAPGFPGTASPAH